MSAFFARLVVLVACLVGATAADALERELRIQELRHTSWGARDGAPAGSIYAVTQTLDGYLWLSDGTLSRFDGLKFEVVELPRDTRLASLRITRLFASGAGGLWIGFNSGAGYLKDGHLTIYTERDGFPPGSSSGFAEEADGTVWASTVGGLARLEGTRWRTIGKDWNYPVQRATIRSVMVDGDGTVWATSVGKAMFLPKGGKAFQDLNIPLKDFVELTESASGSLWLEDGSGLRFIRKSTHPKGRAASSSRGPLFDRDGALWSVRSFTEGVYRIPHPERFEDGRILVEADVPEAFTEKDGLSSNQGSTLFEDREGNVWSGMAQGLDRFSNPTLVRAVLPPLPKGQAIAAPSALVAAADDGALWIMDSEHPLVSLKDRKVVTHSQASALNSAVRVDDGSLWFAGPGNLWHFKEGEFTRMNLPSGTDDFQVQALAEGSSGTMWASIQARGLYEWSAGRWTAHAVLPSAPSLSVITMTSDSQKRIWAGYPDDRIAAHDSAGWRIYTKQDGLQIGNVTALFCRGSHVWAGGEFGLARLDGSRFRSLVPSTEHLFDSITGIVEVANGDLWLNGRAGIVRVSAEEIGRAVADPAHPVGGDVFGTLDGLQGTSLRIRPLPTAIEGTDGRLWFVTSAGFFWIDPTRIAKNLHPPPTKITSIDVDGTSRPPTPAMTLPALSRTLRIDFVGLSLTMAEKVRYRCWLEGLEGGWQDVGARRQALYTGLAPGRYKFHVRAANNDGVWNEQSATIDFFLPPAFAQTGWFYVLCVAAVAALVGIAIRLRVRQISARLRGQVAVRLAERERIARELHDTLLQSTQGLILRFQAVANGIRSDDPMRGLMEQALERADEVMVEGRHRVMDLRVSSYMWGDLPQAFATACDEIGREGAMAFHVATDGRPRELSPRVSEEVYAIGREALINALRHANAEAIDLQVVYGKRALEVSVQDDGVGIEDATLRAGGRPGHWGLTGMRERAASVGGVLLVERLREGGTRVIVKVPAKLAYARRAMAAWSSVLGWLRRLAGSSGHVRDRQ